MLEVKKSGKTEYGYWAIGTLKYKGLEIKSIFGLNQPVEENNIYNVKNLVINNRDSKTTFKIEI